MPYIRLSLNGTLAQGVERWSIGWGYGGTIEVSDPLELFPILQRWADGIVSAIVADETELVGFWSAISAYSRLTDVSLDYRANDSTLIMGARSVLAEPIQGVGTECQSLSTAAVITTLSGYPGGSRRGRIFVPAIGMNVLGTGRFEDDDLAALADSVAWLIVTAGATDTIGTANVSVAPLIWSKKLQAGTVMSQISAGNVPDVMRRRRDNVVEARITRSVNFTAG